MTRKLVESDEVFFLAGGVGTPTNSAVWHYMNQAKVPQLLPVPANLHNFPLPMLQPGITINTAAPTSSRSRRCGWSASTASASRLSAPS